MEQIELYERHVHSTNKYFHIEKSISTKHEKHINKKIMNITLVKQLWLSYKKKCYF
jgi:hypothetical protein